MRLVGKVGRRPQPLLNRLRRLRLLMGIEIRLFLVIDAFCLFSGMPLACFPGLSL